MAIIDSFTGALAPPRPAQKQKALPLISPDGRHAPPNHHWDERFAEDPLTCGFIPTVWDSAEVSRQLALAKDRIREERDAPRRRAEFEREKRERADLHERTRPLTLEERVAALEATVAKLTAPAFMKGRAKSIQGTEGGDEGPLAA